MKIHALDITEILTTQRHLLEDTEVREAVEHLVFELGHATTEKAESFAWECFQDRVQYLITRARNAKEPEPVVSKGSCT